MSSSNTDDKLERLLEARVKANVEAAKAALAAARKSPSVTGSTGQLRANPLYGVAERCDELALKLAAELGKLHDRRARDVEDHRLRDLTTDRLR